MYGVLHIPNFHLQSRLRYESIAPDTPIALLADFFADQFRDRAKLRIVELNSTASNAGVELKMTATQAQARCASLHLLERIPQQETMAQAALLRVAESFSPDFEDTTAGTCTMNLLGSPALKVGTTKFAEFARHRMREKGIDARVGIAGAPELALLAAQHAETTEVIADNPTAVRDFLAPLQLATFQPSTALTKILNLWGIRTVRQLTRLPQDQVTERLGSEGFELWQQASGHGGRLLKLVRPNIDYSESVEFDYEIEQLEQLLFMLRLFLKKIIARLAANYRVAESLTLTLQLVDETQYQQTFRIADPCLDITLLERVLSSHLEGLQTENPVIAMTLEAQPTRPDGSQFQLFESQLRDPNRFSETLTQLAAYLGDDRVGQPHPLPSHRPDAFEIKPFDDDGKTPTASDTSNSAVCCGLPLTRFRPPIEVRIHWTHRSKRILTSEWSGEITDSQGPWIYSGDWWDREQWQRQEWNIQHENGSLLRLVKDPQGWALEGIYG